MNGSEEINDGNSLNYTQTYLIHICSVHSTSIFIICANTSGNDWKGKWPFCR
jgi:hypothetical protein